MQSHIILEIAKFIWDADVPCSKKEAFFSDIFREFRTTYPGLYTMTCSLDFDITKLQSMLGMLDSVHDDTLSQHDASVAVGQQLYQEFVAPVVGGAPPE